jgi:hypothetical protein
MPTRAASLKLFLRNIAINTIGQSFKATAIAKRIIAHIYLFFLNAVSARIKKAHANKSRFPRATANKKGNEDKVIEKFKIPFFPEKLKLPTSTPAQKNMIITNAARYEKLLKIFNISIPNGG